MMYRCHWAPCSALLSLPSRTMGLYCSGECGREAANHRMFQYPQRRTRHPRVWTHQRGQEAPA